MSKKYIGDNSLAKLVKLIKNGINSRVANTEVTDTATANKLLKLNDDGKLPADITGTATKLATPRTIKVTGPVIGSASFDGTSDIEIATSSKGLKVINDVMPPTNASYQLIATRTAHVDSRNMLMFIITSDDRKGTVIVESHCSTNPTNTMSGSTNNSIRVCECSGDDFADDFTLTFKPIGDNLYEFSLWFYNFMYNRRYDITVVNNYMITGSETDNWVFSDVVASINTDRVINFISSSEHTEATTKKMTMFSEAMYANQLKTGRKITLSGDVTGEITFNGSKNVTIPTVIPTTVMNTETFEWNDSNPDSEDRTGLFVSLNEDKLVLADDQSDFILGVVTSCSDGSSTVKMSGTVTVVDDGTCIANGYCNPTTSGIATNVDDYTAFRVLKRIDTTHVKVLMTYMKYITYENTTE